MFYLSQRGMECICPLIYLAQFLLLVNWTLALEEALLTQILFIRVIIKLYKRQIIKSVYPFFAMGIKS